MKFLSDVAPTRDGHYAGKDVKLYTVGKPIYWFKRVGSDAYRVIRADLQTIDLAPEAFRFPFGPPAKPLGGDQVRRDVHLSSRQAGPIRLSGAFIISSYSFLFA